MYNTNSAARTNASGDRVSGGRVVNYCTKPQVSADLQLLRHLTVSAPLTQGSLSKPMQTYSPSHLTVPVLPRHAYVCRRHYSGALTQGSLLGITNA